MKRRTGRSRLRIVSEMNLTPMMDLTFLLLITFIITFPMLEQGIPVNLPKGRADALESQAQSTVVSVDAEGRIYLGEEQMDAATLEQRLAQIVAAAPNTPVLVRGDEKVMYGAVVTVLKITHRLGITRMALVTRED